MSFVRTIKYASTFDGQDVTATLTPLTVADVVAAAGKTGVDVGVLASETVKAHLTEFSLKSADGSDVSPDDLFQYAYFIPLVGELFSSLVGASKVANPNTPAAPSGG